MIFERPILKPNPYQAGTYEHAEFAYTQQCILKSHDQMVEYFKTNNTEQGWEPLLAIAKAAGGEHWYQRAKSAKDYFLSKESADKSDKADKSIQTGTPPVLRPSAPSTYQTSSAW